MHVDDIADRIAIARPDELDWIVKDMWVDHTSGLLTEVEMETLDEAARTRRGAIQERQQTARPRTAPGPESRTTGLRTKAATVARSAGQHPAPATAECRGDDAARLGGALHGRRAGGARRRRHRGQATRPVRSLHRPDCRLRGRRPLDHPQCLPEGRPLFHALEDEIDAIGVSLCHSAQPGEHIVLLAHPHLRLASDLPEPAIASIEVALAKYF
jgi:hypothetical protein